MERCSRVSASLRWQHQSHVGMVMMMITEKEEEEEEEEEVAEDIKKRMGKEKGNE